MPKQNVATLQETAYAAAIEAAPRNGVGSIVDTIDEGDGVTTFLFEAKLKGYVGWRWSITVFEQADSAAATISEVLLMPGPDSLVAPDGCLGLSASLITKLCRLNLKHRRLSMQPRPKMPTTKTTKTKIKQLQAPQPFSP